MFWGCWWSLERFVWLGLLALAEDLRVAPGEEGDGGLLDGEGRRALYLHMVGLSDCPFCVVVSLENARVSAISVSVALACFPGPPSSVSAVKAAEPRQTLTMEPTVQLPVHVPVPMY